VHFFAHTLLITNNIHVYYNSYKITDFMTQTGMIHLYVIIYTYKSLTPHLKNVLLIMIVSDKHYKYLSYVPLRGNQCEIF